MKLSNSALLAALAGSVVAVATANADIWEHDWTFSTAAGGAGVVTDFTVTITGGNAGVGGGTEYTTVLCHDTHIQFSVDYTSVDTGQWDYFYVKIDGAVTPLIYNEGQGLDKFFVYSFLPAGTQFGVGVYTEDGGFGPGVAVVKGLQAWSLYGFGDFNWLTYSENGSGSVNLPPPNLQVTGGNAGFEDRTDGWYINQGRIWSYFGGTYSSTDTGSWDDGYFVTATEGFVPFIDNASQGPYSPIFVFVPANEFFGLGVHTVDGIGGPGIHTVTSYTGFMYPAKYGELGPVFQDTAGGTYTPITDNYFWVDGGNSGFGGYTELQMTALYDYCVEADYFYQSTDTGNWDRAYYSVNGARTNFANNDNQGAGSIDFQVAAGDTFAIGVETVDGIGGPGLLDISRFRAWNAALAGCYADCDGNGALNLFDFLCFTNAFNAAQPYADCDNSGGLNLFDFLCFTNQFNAGC